MEFYFAVIHFLDIKSQQHDCRVTHENEITLLKATWGHTEIPNETVSKKVPTCFRIFSLYKIVHMCDIPVCCILLETIV